MARTALVRTARVADFDSRRSPQPASEFMSSSFTATEIVAAAYRAILLREPDPGGLEQAASDLDQYRVVDQLLAAILSSPEFRTRLPYFTSHYRLTGARPEDISWSTKLPDLSEPFAASDTLHAFILNHSAWRGADVLGKAGDPVQRLQNPELYRCSAEVDRAALGRRGVRVHGMAENAELIVVFDESAAPISVDVYAYGQTDNLLIFGPQCTVQGSFSFGGPGNLAYCGGRSGIEQTYRVVFYTSTSAFVFGTDSTSVGTYFHIEGPRRYTVVSRDCMLAAEIYVASTDNHAIIDQATKAIINPPDDVLIGPHAWIGFGATILKGVSVGENAIIAARAVLTRSAPPGTLSAGAPARVIREGVTWDRAFPSVLRGDYLNGA